MKAYACILIHVGYLLGVYAFWGLSFIRVLKVACRAYNPSYEHLVEVGNFLLCK